MLLAAVGRDPLRREIVDVLPGGHVARRVDGTNAVAARVVPVLNALARAVDSGDEEPVLVVGVLLQDRAVRERFPQGEALVVPRDDPRLFALDEGGLRGFVDRE